MDNAVYYNWVKAPLVVDLHKHSVREAEMLLNNLISSISSDVRELTIIHGYRNGTALLNLVRNEIHSNRIKRKIISGNPGVTYYILNE